MRARAFILFLGVPIGVALITGVLVTSVVLSGTPITYTEPAVVSDTAPDSPPAALSIPSLDVEAHIQYVGRTTLGTMESPDNFTDVGWYALGPAPGQLGSAVVAGHLDNALGLTGVFSRLGEMLPADEVRIETVQGEKLRFQVTRIAEYAYNALPTEVFTQGDGYYLNLVTCSGEWLPELKTYSHRVVVYTTLTERLML